MLRLVMDPRNLSKLVANSGDLLKQDEKDQLLRRLSEEENNQPEYGQSDYRQRANPSHPRGHDPAATIYAVNPSRLGGMDSLESTKTFCSLLRCEARRLGIAPHKILISLNTNINDGGIDARVESADVRDSLLIKGTTYFQIKSGKDFKPW